MKKDIGSLRSTLEYLEAVGELVSTDVEVDPHLEVAAIQKHFDGGAALLFNRVKGYPNARICNNIFASAERIAKLLDVQDPRGIKHRAVEALRKPIPPVEVPDGPCQEVVLTKDFDVWDVVPMISHAESDPGRTLGAGTTVVRGKYFWGGSHIGYNRMNFRGPDFSSFQISPGSHMDQVATNWFRQGPIPMTINIGIPPACTMMAGSGFTYVILPRGCDELGVAGALQGYPVELVKARTQDAWGDRQRGVRHRGLPRHDPESMGEPARREGRCPGRPSLPPRVVGLHGQGVPDVQVPGDGDHPSRRSAALLRPHRSQHGRALHRRPHARSVLSGARGAHRPGPVHRHPYPHGHDRLGRSALSGPQAASARRRTSAQHPDRSPVDLPRRAPRHRGRRGRRSLQYRGHPVGHHHAGEPSGGHPDRVRGRLRSDVPAGGAQLGRRSPVDADQHPLLRRDGDRRHPPLYLQDAFERARYNVEVVDLARFYSPEQIRQAKDGQRDYAKFLADRGI